jgi:glycosyltransferase involved in cell wall biosynthesis
LTELKALISSLGLEDRVKITGYLDNDKALSALSISDVILLPYISLITRGSYALSYAIAAKRPVITSNTPFFVEIEQKYSAIKTFEPTDSQALVKAINEALDCHGQEATGAEEYRKIWSWKNVAEKTYKIYCDVLFKKTH